MPPSLVSRTSIISLCFYLVCTVRFRSGLRDFDRLFWKMFWTCDAITKKSNIAVNVITTAQLIEVKNWPQDYLFQNWHHAHHRSLKMIKLKVLKRLLQFNLPVNANVLTDSVFLKALLHNIALASCVLQENYIKDRMSKPLIFIFVWSNKLVRICAIKSYFLIVCINI